MTTKADSNETPVEIVGAEAFEQPWSEKEDDDLEHRQMALFASATSERTTNTIHLYDIAPKFTYSGRELNVAESAFRQRTMKVANVEYVVEVQAARIQHKTGEEVLIYPGEREECIEDSLRKLATSGNGVFINGEAGVRFTLYELRADLQKHKHTYSWPQLREGLYVLRRAGLRITNKKTGESWEEGFLSRLVEGGKRSSENGYKYELWYASFHKLVTKSITDLSYRQMNYPRLMSIPGQLAKYIYKRMVSVYIYADLEKPYQPTLVQLMEESGRGMSPEMKNNIKAMNRALEQLKCEGAILHAEEHERTKAGRKVVNIRYNIYPTPTLVNEIIEANKKQKELRATTNIHEIQKLKDSITT